MNSTLKIFIPLAFVFAVLVASNFLYAQWTAPAGTPSTGNNAPAPLNVSDSSQTKEGDLTIQGTTTIGSNKSNLVVKGITDMNKGLLVNGGAYIHNKVKANRYCDRDGLNCFKATDVDGTASSTASTTGQSIMGEIGSTGVNWPDIITCNTSGSGVGAGALFYVSGGVYSTVVGYKFSDNMENSGSEVMVAFNKNDGSYYSAQGVGGACTGRSIQDFISTGEAYYTGSGWTGGSVPVSYSWQQVLVSSCTASTPSSCGSTNTGTVTYDVYCASSADPTTPVADSFCASSGAKPLSTQTCYRYGDCSGAGP